jgi:signal transduction histidine kinase/FixJ family two-component response regulator
MLSKLLIVRKENLQKQTAQLSLYRNLFPELFITVNPHLESFTDISYLKAADEQKRRVEFAEQANSTKSEFLANISHEMRTPLNAVLGLSGLTLEMEGLDEEAVINLEKIYSSGSTLLNIINDILDISKIEAGKLELIPNEYDVPSLINDVITQNILRIGSKLIAFTLNISSDIPAALYGDDLRIKQVLSNLLSNAFKYTREGTVELGMRSEYAEYGEAVWLTAWVRDTGMGIRPEDVEKLFSDYSQVDTKANRKIEGTGLGLAITKKMIELMGGTIGVESEYGKGSIFTIKFKQKFVTDTVIGETVVNNLKSFRYSNDKRKQSSRIARIKMPYARVLVVDDNLTNLDVAKGLLKPYGMQVDCLTRGQQAIDTIRAEEGKYDAVFMDHMMPEMDGIEATQLIRQIDTVYAKNVPIIALTANAIIGNEEKFLSNGFQDFLSKPIDLPRLDEALRRWVRDKTKENQAMEAESENPLPTKSQPSILKFQIDGANLKKGLERFGGDEEVFLGVLRSYAVNTRPVLQRIREVNKDNLGDYATDVHGIKGSSRGIFAIQIADLAEKLEIASKKGDLNYVNENNARFIESTEKFIINIEDILATANAQNPKRKKDKLDTEVLHKLIFACGNYDIDGVDEAMTEIEEYEYESESEGELKVWLRANVLEGNYKEIAERLSNLTEREDV